MDQHYQQLMVLFSSFVVALKEQDFPDDAQQRILAKTTSALTSIYTAEVLSKPRKRTGVFRTASTPATKSKKVPADQRVQFTPSEAKVLKKLDELIRAKLSIAGLTMERFFQSLAQKGGRVTPSSLREGMNHLDINLPPEDLDLLLRKYNAHIDESNIDFGEYTHLFPPKPPVRSSDSLAPPEAGSENKTQASESSKKPKRKGQPGRSITFKDNSGLPPIRDISLSPPDSQEENSDESDGDDTTTTTPPRESIET